MTKWLHFHFSLSCIGEGNGNPLQYSCLENPRDRGAWWAAVCGVAQSRTQLMWLSSSSSSSRDFKGVLRWIFFFYYCKRHHWDFDRDCIESVDYFGWYWHLNNWLFQFMNMECIYIYLSSLISFSIALQFSLHKSFNSLAKLNPK